MNCNLAAHRPARPEQSTSHAKLWKGLAVAGAAAVLTAVVCFALLGNSGDGASPAAGTVAESAAQQNITTAGGAALPQQTTPLQIGGDSSGVGQQSVQNAGQDPMAPAELRHISVPLQYPGGDATAEVT